MPLIEQIQPHSAQTLRAPPPCPLTAGLMLTPSGRGELCCHAVCGSRRCSSLRRCLMRRPCEHHRVDRNVLIYREYRQVLLPRPRARGTHVLRNRASQSTPEGGGGGGVKPDQPCDENIHLFRVILHLPKVR